MLPESIRAEIEAKGGLAGAPEPQGNGTTIYRAVSGDYVVVHDATGQLRMRGFSPPADPTAQTTPSTTAAAAAPAQPAGVGGMNQQQLEALLAQMGTLGPGDFREEVKTEEAPNPKYDGTDITIPPTIKQQVVYRTWIKPGTNQRLTVKVNADGTYAQVFSGADPSINPTKPAGATSQQIEGTPTGNGQLDNERPRMVTRNAGDQEIGSRPLTPAEEKQWRENRERSRNPGGKTDQQIADEKKEAQAQAERNRPGAPTLKPDGKGGTVAVQAMPDGSIKTTPLPEVPSDKPQPQTITVDGVVYERNPQTGQYARAEGVPAAGGGPQGPALPVLVLGQVQAGLRTYKDQLNAQVASGQITPTVADKRWTEAKELGGVAITEAQTAQRDEESRRNADVNLRTNAMSNATSGFTSALSFVQDINSKLPEGSTAGGEAFAAILGLQQLHAKRMGAYDTPYSGSGAPRLQEARGIDAATQSATATTNTTSNGLPSKPPETPAASPAPTPAASVPALASPSPAAAAGPPVSPARPAAAPAAPPQLPEATPGGGPPAPVGAPGFTGWPTAPPGVPPGGYWQQAGEPVPIPGGAPGETVPYPSDAALQSTVMPGDDFAALARFDTPRSPVYPVLARPDSGQDMVALRRAQLASTVPWRLSTEDLEEAQRNGWLDQALAIPGAL